MKYNPNHYLATFPPDNGYLRIALEQGYIGLILFMTLLFTGLRVGVRNYYRARNPKIRNYLIAFITLAFSVTIALYAQSVTSQMPMYMIFWPVMGFMSRIMDFDYEESSQVDA